MTEQPTPTAHATRGIGLQLALIAAVASIGLTAAAFWLSYEHLHDVAHTHGLADAARSWAWPATVDMFILIGEVLMLRGSLAGRIDRWAITLTAIGSAGSIALNVAGVGAGAGPMNYVVAAVPPVAALLAFGALMRQIHGALAGRMAAPEDVAEEVPLSFPAVDSSPVNAVAGEPAVADNSTEPVAPLASTEAPPVVGPEPTVVAAKTPASVDSTPRQEPTPATAPVAKKIARKPARTTQRRSTSKAPRRSMGEWVETAGPIFHAEFQRLRRQPTASEFATAIDTAGLGRVSDSTAKNIRTEILDRTDVPALDQSD